MEKLTVHPKAEAQHERTLIFLHGYEMEASDLLDLFLRLNRERPTWRFVLPQAPKMRITASGAECFSWFDYLTDREGEGEDAVDIFSLRARRVALRQLLHAEVGLLGGREDRVFLGGLSQGGTMALDVTAHMRVGGVVTLVAPRSSTSLARNLQGPWLALMAREDDVFPLSWARALLVGALSVEVVEGDHWLDGAVEHSFLRSALEKFEAMVKTEDAELRV